LGTAAECEASVLGIGYDFIVGAGEDLLTGFVDEAPLSRKTDHGEFCDIKRHRFLVALGNRPLPSLWRCFGRCFGRGLKRRAGGEGHGEEYSGGILPTEQLVYFKFHRMSCGRQAGFAGLVVGFKGDFIG